MAKYRKKSVVIEAEVFRFGLEDSSECSHGSCKYSVDDDNYCNCEGIKCEHAEYYIDTLEGRMKINEGDYIVTGIKGERYPRKPDIFEATHEIVEE